MGNSVYKDQQTSVEHNATFNSISTENLKNSAPPPPNTKQAGMFGKGEYIIMKDEDGNARPCKLIDISHSK